MKKIYYLCLALGIMFSSTVFISCGSDDGKSNPENSTNSGSGSSQDTQPQKTADRDEAGNILINEKNFPDAAFRKYLLAQNYGTDGVLTIEEFAEIKNIDVSLLNIQSLQGIDFFTALVRLDCEKNPLTSLDMSNNVLLEDLKCEECQIATLNVSKNVKLTRLSCHSNQLTSLDVSNNVQLAYLHCPQNKLNVLNVSKNVKLINLSCSDNQLTSLDVSKNTLLEELYCYYNQLTYLDVSNNTKLTYLRYDTDKVTITGWPK